MNDFKEIKKSKKLKSKVKNSLLIGLSSLAILTSSLAVIELTDFSIVKLQKTVKEFILGEQIAEHEEGEDGLPNEASINGITINGKEYLFEENKINYSMELPYNTEDMLKIEYIKKNDKQAIKGENEYIMAEYTKTISFEVWSEDKTNKMTYTLNLRRGNNAYLKNIELPGYNLFPEFSSEILDYKISLPEDITSVNIFASAWDKESNIIIEGQDSVGIGEKIILTVTNPYVSEATVYTITCEDSDTIHNFSYTGEYQEFIAPYTGSYKFEVWGARGGYSRKNGSLYSVSGQGGYASGEINIRKGEKYYVYVGQQGTDAVVKKDSAATWNGGGLGTWDRSDNETAGAGGGATDIRLIPGAWNDTTSLASRIIVAGRRRRNFLDICRRKWPEE